MPSGSSVGAGGSRMLRARRKDQNVKPNRRLDRKSSRGMLFENEELRMRTITINAEVEQGQHALKKLRRENEQLRREMWSLRDEYDKMEKLLRNKKCDNDDDDDSDQDYDSEYSQSEESDEEAKTTTTTAGNTEENPDLENEENLQKSTRFNNLPLRSFDGLSVIDEQTEETDRQTADSATGYSRGNSSNRTFDYNEWNSRRQMYDEACGGGGSEGMNYPSIGVSDYGQLENNEEFRNMRKKGVYPYNGTEHYAPGPGWSLEPWELKDNGVRPSSPYPYNKNALLTPYDKKIELLQTLPITPYSDQISDNNWPYTQPINQYGFVLPPEELQPQPPTEPITVQIPMLPEYDFDSIQPRTGPDYFITGAYTQTPLLPTDENQTQEYQPKPGQDGVDTNVVVGIENNTMIETADQGQCEVKKEETLPNMTQELKIDPDVSLTCADENKRETRQEVSVVCQSADNQLVNNCETSPRIDFPGIQNRIALFENSVKQSESVEMPRAGSAGGGGSHTLPQKQRGSQSSKPFQSKLMVTLKNPTRKDGGKAMVFPQKVQHMNVMTGRGRSPMRTFLPQTQTGRYRHNLHLLPCTSSQYPVTNGDGGQDEFQDDHDEPDEEGEHIPSATSGVRNGVKAPPDPPPRTSSYSGNNLHIPSSSVGVTAIHHRAFRKGRSQSPKIFEEMSATAPVILETNQQNPLLASLPTASSSPQLSTKKKLQHTESDDKNPFKNSSNNDDSSLDETGLVRQSSTKSDITHGSPKLSLHKTSSPNLHHFRKSYRKQSQLSLSSLENIPNYSSNSQLIERKNRQNNISVSSSSGLDSPTKSDRRKRRVSIKFNKKQPVEELKMDENLEAEFSKNKKDSVSSRKISIRDKFIKHRSKSKNDEEVSERERTNSVSSRTSSIVNSSRRKFSITSTKTLGTDEKIPWCGCWGNGCV